MFSIVILTYNEESSIKKCLESITWCDDIVLIDSYSTDNTVAIAKEFNARVFENKFIDFAAQRNFANNEVKFKYDWVFHLDADEYFNLDLKKECEQVLKEYKYGAFLVPAKEMLWNKPLNHSAGKVYQMRFMKLSDASFIQHGHGQRETNLKKGLGKLVNQYEHHSFQKGLSHWFYKHIKYAEQEAQNSLEHNVVEFRLCSIFSGNEIERRRALKHLANKMPFRSFLKFTYMYVFKRGFLDGKVGFVFCLMKAIYEQIIVIKMYELNLRFRGVNP